MRATIYSRLCAALILLLLAAGLRGFAAPPSVDGTNEFPMHIVTCEDGVDVDALLKEHGVTPRHRYRHALNGFAAPLPQFIVSKTPLPSSKPLFQAPASLRGKSPALATPATNWGPVFSSVNKTTALISKRYE